MKLVAILLASALLAVSALDATTLAQINKLGENSNFGAYIQGLVELKVAQNTNVQHIIDTVQRILDGLLQVQTTEDMQHSTRNAELEGTIAQLETSLENISAELQATNRLVSDLTSDIAALSQSSVSQQRQLQTLNDRVTSLSEQRSQENEEHRLRVAGHNRMLNAVITVHTHLSKAVLDNPTLIQRDEVLRQMKQELGHKNPAVLMVEMTTKFDRATAVRVIEKLEEIQRNIEATLQREEESEAQAQVTFQTVTGQINDVISRLGRDFQQSQTQLRNKQNDLVVAARRSQELNQEQTTTQELLVQNRNQRDVAKANYQARSSQRQEEIRIVTQARDLLRENQANLQQ